MHQGGISNRLVGLTNGCANAAAEGNALAVEEDRERRECDANSLSNDNRLDAIGVRQHDQEFLSAEPTDGVVGADAALDALSGNPVCQQRL